MRVVEIRGVIIVEVVLALAMACKTQSATSFLRADGMGSYEIEGIIAALLRRNASSYIRA